MFIPKCALVFGTEIILISEVFLYDIYLQYKYGLFFALFFLVHIIYLHYE